jgi:plasmid stability protein
MLAGLTKGSIMAPKQNPEDVRTMAVNLSIKNVDEQVVERLRQRAARSHRSLQGELMAIIEQHAYGEPRLTPEEVLDEVRRRRLRTPREALKMIRADRHGR